MLDITLNYENCDRIKLFESEVSSRLYGYNIETSDSDRQGFYIPNLTLNLIDWKNVEQSITSAKVEDNIEVTITLHHFNKICERVVNSNLTTVEMLLSDIQYVNLIPSEIENLKSVFKENFNLYKLLFQYRGIINSNKDNILSNKKLLKSLIQFYRCAISYQFLYNTKKLPPIKVSELIETGMPFSKELRDIVASRKNGDATVSFNADKIQTFCNSGIFALGDEKIRNNEDLYEAVCQFSYSVKLKVINEII